MFSVYSGDRVIFFVGDSDPSATPGEAAEFDPAQPGGSAKVLEKLGNSKRIFIKCADPAAVFAGFCGGMARAEAAGGLVRNSAGDSLMIFRQGMWDLPKGHVDEGESYEECALREVREECGLENITLGGPLCDTYHIYERDGAQTVKRTRWYAMHSDDRRLTPEVAEGIEKAEWVPEREVAGRLAQSYRTIAEVFNSYSTSGRV